MKKMPKSLRKFIRSEKARIRRVVLYVKDQDKQIDEMYEKLAKKPEVKAPAAKIEAKKKPEAKVLKPKVKKIKETQSVK